MDRRVFTQRYEQSILNKKHHENCSLLGYYAACTSNSLLTFRDSVLVPCSVFKKFCPKSAFVCFLWISKQAMTFVLRKIK